MKFFTDSIFYSYAQIFFSNRRWFGILIIIASFVTPQLGIMALLGVALSNASAIILKFDADKIRSGFYGFNGILFGAGASFFFNVDLFLLSIILIFIIITFFISAVLENHLAVTFNLPGLSLPFIISLYIFIIFLSNYDFIKPAFFGSSQEIIFSSLPVFVADYLRSLSLIIFQPNVASGLIIALALLFFSRVLFLLSIFSFALCLFYLNLILPGMHSDYLILFGFNSILTAFALGGSLIIPSRKSFLLVIISVLMVVIITGFFIRLFAGTNLPVFVLPFNFIVLSTIYSLKFRKENTDLTLLYFNPGSPEENFYYHQRRRARFDKFKFIFPELPFLGEWFVSQGFNGQHTHKEDWKYAWDFVVKDDMGNECTNEGKELSDFYCFKLPVAAPLDGEVVKVVDGIPNNRIGDVDLKNNWGNTIILKHEYGLFSALSHLESGSLKVNEGDKVKKGVLIAECGSSGRSPIPHLHFQYQATDKLGDKTFKFPFAHYLEKKNGEVTLKTFYYPQENSQVKNIEINREIKNAVGFRFGDKLKFFCKQDEKEFDEEWEVKINMNNELYIESSLGDTAGIYITDKVLHFTSYTGNKKSALYYFYLIAMRIPFCYQKNLKWNDEYSIDQLRGTVIRYLSELFLFYRNFISVKGSFRYEENTDDEVFRFTNKIEAEGVSIFSFYKEIIDGEVSISQNGFIKEFKIKSGNKIIFSAANSMIEEKNNVE